jgi:hypothetical protein
VNRLEKIVTRLLSEVGGGEAYFDRLDAEMRRAENLPIVRELLDVSGNVVASGGFGLYLLKLRRQGLITLDGNLAVMTGSLRRGAAAEIVHRDAPLRGTFTFVDDSYYSGNTESRVRARLETDDARLIRTRVIYDGSPQTLPRRDSLYRYYDRHGR